MQRSGLHRVSWAAAGLGWSEGGRVPNLQQQQQQTAVQGPGHEMLCVLLCLPCRPLRERAWPRARARWREGHAWPHDVPRSSARHDLPGGGAAQRVAGELHLLLVYLLACIMMLFWRGIGRMHRIMHGGALAVAAYLSQPLEQVEQQLLQRRQQHQVKGGMWATGEAALGSRCDSRVQQGGLELGLLKGPSSSDTKQRQRE